MDAFDYQLLNATKLTSEIMVNDGHSNIRHMGCNRPSAPIC